MKRTDDILPRKIACPSCGFRDMRLFYEMTNLPVNSVMNCGTRDDARAFPRGDLSLGLCHECGFIWNTDFDAKAVRYSSECEESQGSSPTFNAFARHLAQHLVDKYKLNEKKIIEIGCGKGEFLKLICSLGRNDGIGIDPAYIPGRKYAQEADGQVEFIQDYFSEKYSYLQGDLICCRMTLEHIPDPAHLVATLRRSIGNRTDTVVFIQVPDVMRILKTCAFEDIYYEHCSYFSPGSLARLFQRNGFDILDLQTVYSDQYVLLEARPASEARSPSIAGCEDVGTMEDLVLHFQAKCPEILRHWENQLSQFKQKEKKVVLWGGGSKGVAFLHALNTADSIEYVVDISPYRQQTFMAGSGQKIIAPQDLKEYRPDVVIIMNAIYTEEIRRELNDLALNPSLLTLESRETTGD